MAPERTCVGCRARRPQSAMLRVRRRPDGQVVPLPHTRQHRGRTAYLCARWDCVELASRKRAITAQLGRGGVSVTWAPAQLWAEARSAYVAELELLQRSRPTNPSPRGRLATPESPRERTIKALLEGLSSQPAPPLRSLGRES